MIVDSIKNCERYYGVHPDFKAVFEALMELSSLENPKSFVLREGEVWGNVAEFSEPPSGDREFEAHKRFIDIHFVISGEEIMGYSDTDKLSVTKEYKPEKDFMMLKGDISALGLSKGEFCVVFPNDAHIPVMDKNTDGKLVKVVVKIKL